MSRSPKLVTAAYYLVSGVIAVAVWGVAEGRLGWWVSFALVVGVLVALRPVWNRFAIPRLTRRLLARRAHT